MRKRFHQELERLMMEGMIDVDQADLIGMTFDFQLNRTIEDLRRMIDDWNSWNTEEKFYPLAVYRIIDMIEERSVLDRLPILETKDTNDE